MPPTLLTAVLQILRLVYEIRLATAAVTGKPLEEIPFSVVAELLAGARIIAGEPVPFNPPQHTPPVDGGGLVNNIANISTWGWNTGGNMQAVQEVLAAHGVTIGAGESWDTLPDKIRAIPFLIAVTETARISSNLTAADNAVFSFPEITSLAISDTAQIGQGLTAQGTAEIDGEKYLLPGTVYAALEIQAGNEPPAEFEATPRDFNPALEATDTAEIEPIPEPVATANSTATISGALNAAGNAAITVVGVTVIPIAETVQLETVLSASDTAVATFPETTIVNLAETPQISGALSASDILELE